MEFAALGFQERNKFEEWRICYNQSFWRLNEYLWDNIICNVQDMDYLRNVISSLGSQIFFLKVKHLVVVILERLLNILISSNTFIELYTILNFTLIGKGW